MCVDMGFVNARNMSVGIHLQMIKQSQEPFPDSIHSDHGVLYRQYDLKSPGTRPRLLGGVHRHFYAYTYSDIVWIDWNFALDEQGGSKNLNNTRTSL